MRNTNDTSLNLDIWLEIVLQYRFSMLDDEDTSKAKKAALRSLALVSRRFTFLAQSEMWRTVRSTRHISEYIKDIESSNLIRNVSPNVLRQPLQPGVVERVQIMLSCTKDIILDNSAKLIFSDWEFVQMATGETHLFKNLKSVDIDWDACRGSENGQMIPPLLLASPGLQHIAHRNVTHEDEAVLLLFHSMLRIHNAPITSVRLLKGKCFSPGVVFRMVHSASPNAFMSIEAVRLSRQDRFAAWYVALVNCPNLTSLRIHESSANPACWDYSKDEIIRLGNLRCLEINGKPQHVSLLQQLDCPILVSLTLRLWFLPGCSDIFSSISHFTQLEKVLVTIRKSPRQDPPFLQLRDLRPVFDSFPTLHHLRVIGAASLLTEVDVSEILVMKPSLRILTISGPSSYTLHPSIISSVAQHRLRSMCLPIDIPGIRSLTVPPIGTSGPHLVRFIVSEYARLPESMEGKLHIVEFIHHMFPRAKIYPLYETDMSKSLEDLETMRADSCKRSSS